MDPAKLAAKLLQENFKKFGGFRNECTYQVTGDADYTGGNVTETVTASYPLNIIFDEFSFTATMAGDAASDDSAIRSIDRKAIFPALDLPAVPKINDRIVDQENTKWRVVALSKDPGPAHHELHIRPVGD